MSKLKFFLYLVLIKNIVCIENSSSVPISTNNSKVSGVKYKSFFPESNSTNSSNLYAGNNTDNSSKKIVTQKMNLKSSIENKDSDFRPSVQLATIDKLPANIDDKESQLTTVNLLPSKSVIPMTSVVYHPVYESPVNAGTVLVPILPSAKQPVKFIYDYQGQQNNQQLKHQQQQHDNASPDGSNESNPYHQLYGESYVLFHPSAQDTYASHDSLDNHHNQSSHENLSVNNTPDDNRQEDNDDDADHETQQNHNSHPYKIISYQSPSGHHIPSEQVNLQNQNQPDHQEILSVPEVPGHESFSDTHERHPNLNKFHYHHHYKLPDSTYEITSHYPQKTQYIAVDPTPYHYQYVVPESSEIERPEMHPYYHDYYQQYHQSPVHIHHPEIVIDKPEAVVYLTSHRETSFTRTRKFPYKYYQPHEQGTQVHLPDQGYAGAPQHKR